MRTDLRQMNDHDRVNRTFLVDRHDLMAYIRALCWAEDDAEDIFQDTWMALNQAVGRGEDISNVAAWSRTVARRLWLRGRRSQRRERPDDLAVAEAIDAVFTAHPTEPEVHSRLVDALRACLARAEAGVLRLIDRRYGEGVEVADLAAEAGTSVDTMCMRLSRLRRRLRLCIERRLGAA